MPHAEHIRSSARQHAAIASGTAASDAFVPSMAAKLPDNQQDLALFHVDRTLARLSKLLDTAVVSPEAQSMLQPLLRRNIQLAQFSLAVLLPSPAGPMPPLRRLQQSQTRQNHAISSMFPAESLGQGSVMSPPALRLSVSSPAVLLTAPSRQSAGKQANNSEKQDENPDEVWNLAEDVTAIASLMYDLANPRHITVSLDCPHAILLFRGPRLLSSRHMILVADYCLSIIEDYGHLIISLHWPPDCDAQTPVTVKMGQRDLPTPHATSTTALASGAKGDDENAETEVKFKSFAGAHELALERKHPVVCIRASPVSPQDRSHVPTLADIPTPIVSSIRMRYRLESPASGEAERHECEQEVPHFSRTPPVPQHVPSTKSPIETSSPPSPHSPASTPPRPVADIPQKEQEPIARSITHTHSESSDSPTPSTPNLDCTLVIEIELPLTAVPRPVGPKAHTPLEPPVLPRPVPPPTPSSPIFTAPVPSPPTVNSDTHAETHAAALESFANSLNGYPIGYFPTESVLHSLRDLGVVPYPMRNVTDFPRLCVVQLPSPLLKKFVVALRQLPRQELIGVLAILDSDDQVVDVFEWLNASAISSPATEARVQNLLQEEASARQHMHFEGSHNLLLHIAPNPPSTLLLLESLILLNGTLHLIQGGEGATKGAEVTGAGPAIPSTSTSSSATFREAGASARLASRMTGNLKHWGLPTHSTNNPGLVASTSGFQVSSPTDAVLAQWDQAMDLLAEACGVGHNGSTKDDSSRDSSNQGGTETEQAKEVPVPSLLSEPVSSSSMPPSFEYSVPLISPFPLHVSTTPLTPGSQPHGQHSTEAKPIATYLLPSATSTHCRIKLSHIPESIRALGTKLLPPYVPISAAAGRQVSNPPGTTGAAAASGSASGPTNPFHLDVQRIWSPLVPMRSLTVAPPDLYYPGNEELQSRLTSLAAGLRPPPHLESPGGPMGETKPFGGTGVSVRRPSALKRKSDGSLKGFLPLLSVLVVEDDPIATRILSIFLARRSINHITVTTGPQALHHFTYSGPFHVVLMNLGLAQQAGHPDMDGLECTRQMRQLELQRGTAAAATLPPTVIIALTADTCSETHRAAQMAGCNEVAVKPVPLKWIEDKLVEVAALMGLVQPAMTFRQLAAVGGEHVEPEVSEEQRQNRHRARTWADQTSRGVSGATGRVQAGSQSEQQPPFCRQRSLSADAQGAGRASDQLEVEEENQWGGSIVEGGDTEIAEGYGGGSRMYVVSETKEE